MEAAATVCSACGQENPAGARFCLACGSPLATDGSPRAERRIVTVIFVDLVGFTARAERLDPEDVRALLEPYHDRVRREIESFGGVVEKFIGDAVMGVFGAPLAHGDDAERAVRAALVVRDVAGELADGGLQIRIAVNTGEAVVTMGARPALGESMVAGDVVNTAARLQAAAPVNGVVVGEETYRTTRGAIEYAAAEPVVAKGKERPVEAWIALRALTAAGERPTDDAAMIGREPERELLEALWRRVVHEQVPHLVSVFGPAGVGKSTLAAEFGSFASGTGARVVHGRSLPYRESGAYGALAAQVMQLAGAFESDPAALVAEKLHGRAAELLAETERDPHTVAAHLGAIVGIDEGADAPNRDTLFYSVLEFLEAEARRRPLVLVFEDIHWAGANMLDLVHALATRLRALPVFFLTLARPDLLDARADWGAGVPGYTALTLGPLAPEHARELAVRRLRGTEHVDQVLRVAEGNPLFIEQLAASYGELATNALPTTIRELVAARLDALPRDARALLLDAAVVGKVFWADALRSIDRERDVPGLLEQLEHRDLVRREPASFIEGQQQFAFTHLLIRDVAYDLLSRQDRVRRHALVAEFFGTRTNVSSDAIGAIARHLRAAGDNDRAVDQLVRAAEVAERGWAKDHAALLYREAFELVPEEDADRRSALRRRLAIAASSSFHVPDVRRAGSRPA